MLAVRVNPSALAICLRALENCTQQSFQSVLSLDELPSLELGHNTGPCARSRMTLPNRPLFWIASLIGSRASTALAFDVHSVVGRPAKTTAGLVAAAKSGIRSTREECAPRVFTSGLRRSAFHVPVGRRILISVLSSGPTLAV